MSPLDSSLYICGNISLEMTKYKLLFNEMLEKNPELFEEFEEIHNKYTLNPEQHQEEFNKIGRKVRDVLRKYENILCGKSENTGYSQYSSNLAQKFQDEVRAHFPKIDFIGLKIGSATPQFNLKKIDLN